MFYQTPHVERSMILYMHPGRPAIDPQSQMPPLVSLQTFQISFPVLREPPLVPKAPQRLRDQTQKVSLAMFSRRW